MSDEPFLIKLEEVKEHENGDATYTFEMSDAAEKSVMQEGLKLLLYCGLAKVDLQDVFDWILAQGEKPEAKLPEGRNPISDDWFREKAAAFTFDEYGYYGENNGPLPPTEKIREMNEQERQRSKEREQANKKKKDE